MKTTTAENWEGFGKLEDILALKPRKYTSTHTPNINKHICALKYPNLFVVSTNRKQAKSPFTYNE